MMKIWLAYLGLLFTVNVVGQTPDILDKPPLVEAVSVNPDSSVYIEWQKSSSTEVVAYKIMVIIGNSGFIVDSVNAVTLSTTLSKLLINAPWGNRNPLPQVYDQPVRFQVEGYDINRNSSGKGFFDTQHQTVFLKTKFDSCSSRIILTWTNYIGWADQLKEYYIWVDSAGYPSRYNTPFTKKDTVQSIPVLNNKSYTFHISAVNKTGNTVNSNFVKVSTKRTTIPDILVAQSASFLAGSNQVVKLQFTLDPNSELHQYELYSSGSPNGSFSRIMTLKNITGTSLTTTDTLHHLSPRYYQLKIDDLCGDTVKTSNLATAIVPTYQTSKGNIILSWNPYLTWPGNTTYEIFRSIGNNPVETVGMGFLTPEFTDDMKTLISMQVSGNICYSVDAINAVTNERSSSSSVCIDLSAEIFVPDAFTPNDDGKNDEFKPFFAFLPTTTDYHLIIYNRYGSRIFESTDPLKGWNGRLGSGSRAPAGEYMYFISYSSSSGKKVTRNGAISLIYP